eukprot:14728664-Alexandrium_andersonii.AAC.1
MCIRDRTWTKLRFTPRPTSNARLQLGFRLEAGAQRRPTADRRPSMEAARPCPLQAPKSREIGTLGD